MSAREARARRAVRDGCRAIRRTRRRAFKAPHALVLDESKKLFGKFEKTGAPSRDTCRRNGRRWRIGSRIGRSFDDHRKTESRVLRDFPR
jgi:hypothetical protein